MSGDERSGVLNRVHIFTDIILEVLPYVRHLHPAELPIVLVVVRWQSRISSAEHVNGGQVGSGLKLVVSSFCKLLKVLIRKNH